MQRISCPERDDWRDTAQAAGFDFHTPEGERYWDERAYYAFKLDEIERQIEAPTGEIDAMCLELVGRAVRDERDLRRLKIPEAFWQLIRDSWHRDEGSLYGRLDLSFDGRGPAKLLEYNADTPTSIFEAAVFQWTWLEQAIERHILPAHADQFNSLHERLIEAWKKIGNGVHLHLAGSIENAEDAGTLAYLEDAARQAGLPTTLLDIEAIGWRDDGTFVALSNKGILALLWEIFPGHPNLLPAFFEDDPNAAMLGTSFVRKPLYSREGANVALIREGETVVEQQGPYGAEGFIRQALALLPNFSGQYPVLGSWLIDHTPCGLSIREDENPITGNTSRFLPHAIL